MFKNHHILFEHLFYFNVLFYIVLNQKHSIIEAKLIINTILSMLTDIVEITMSECISCEIIKY